MIIGYDSVRCGKTRRFIMTASYEATFSKFFSVDKISEENQGVGPVGALLRDCLNHFFLVNKINPQMIFLYRSGATETEKRTIINHELPCVTDLLSGDKEKGYLEGYNPKICYMVVNKKADVKFFETGNGNGLNNPREGTVVDTQLVTPESFEFYLQPQWVNQGTATPTHFHVIYNSIDIPLEILEQITYRQCYYYWNWSGAIRVPAALKFAETAGKFISTNMGSNYVKDSLKNSPYYI